MAGKKTIQYFWEADVKIKIEKQPGLGFSVQTKRKKEKIKGSSYWEFDISEWINGEKIVFDTGKRLRGWFKSNAKTIRPSLADSLQYGLRCLSKPHPGFVEIADISELEGMNTEPDAELQREYRLPPNSNLPYPKKDSFVTGTGKDMRSVFSFYYVLPKEVELDVKIISFARNFTPEMAKWMLEKLGSVQGIGDRYSNGFGLFSLVDFKAEKEEIPL